MVEITFVLCCEVLASWFRLKYPHIALGALASSAPILYFDNITLQNRYYSIVTKDFRDVSESCYQTIRKSWSIINKIASKPNDLYILSRKFKLCQDLNLSRDLKDYLDLRFFASEGNQSCYSIPIGNAICGWSWQRCSEMVIPIEHGDGATMFFPAPFNLQQFPRTTLISLGFHLDHIGSQPIMEDRTDADVNNSATMATL
nr:lysosomal Pro-X carboxypeptidase-like [Ipomoea batatas]